MNKIQINKELIVGKGIWNATKVVAGINVALVCFHKNTWKVIHKDKTFQDVTKRKYMGRDNTVFHSKIYKRVYAPIKEFYYKKDLVNYVFENQIIN